MKKKYDIIISFSFLFKRLYNFIILLVNFIKFELWLLKLKKDIIIQFSVIIINL